MKLEWPPDAAGLVVRLRVLLAKALGIGIMVGSHRERQNRDCKAKTLERHLLT